MVEVLDLALRGHPGPVLAPMTLTDPAYAAEILGTLRGRGHEVHHVALLADRAVVLERLRRRGLGFGLRFETWAVQGLDGCLGALSGPEFAEQLRTDDLTVPQVAERVAAVAGLALGPDTDGALLGWLHRATVGLRHVRLPSPAGGRDAETARTARARTVPIRRRSARVGDRRRHLWRSPPPRP